LQFFYCALKTWAYILSPFRTALGALHKSPREHGDAKLCLLSALFTSHLSAPISIEFCEQKTRRGNDGAAAAEGHDLRPASLPISASQRSLHARGPHALIIHPARARGRVQVGVASFRTSPSSITLYLYIWELVKVLRRGDCAQRVRARDKCMRTHSLGGIIIEWVSDTGARHFTAFGPRRPWDSKRFTDLRCTTDFAFALLNINWIGDKVKKINLCGYFCQ